MNLAEASEQHAMPHRHHAVLVEDNDDVRDALAMALNMVGADVTAFGNARDALAALRGGLDPCVILLDWRMPEMYGEAFLSAWMQDAPVVGTAVVAVTGDSLDTEHATTLGVCEVVRKPVDPGVVFAAVERHCPRRDAE